MEERRRGARIAPRYGHLRTAGTDHGTCPGRAEYPGRAELTDAEPRVAALAAAGATNRQIAGKLFITVSTVEQHLTKTYRKLNVRRRSGLSAGLRQNRSWSYAGALSVEASNSADRQLDTFPRSLEPARRLSANLD